VTLGKVVAGSLPGCGWLNVHKRLVGLCPWLRGTLGGADPGGGADTGRMPAQ
jgi:hypothetical protein